MPTQSKPKPTKNATLTAHLNAIITGKLDNRTLLDKSQLAALLNTTPRGVECMTRARKIPVIKLGHRTLRYLWPRVCEALAKREVREV
ncbi:MAG: hypothetical protein WCK55_18095 [Verrucomicrobiota bacterium]